MKLEELALKCASVALLIILFVVVPLMLITDDFYTNFGRGMEQMWIPGPPSIIIGICGGYVVRDESLCISLAVALTSMFILSFIAGFFGL